MPSNRPCSKRGPLNPGLYKPLYLPNTTGAELLGLIDSSSRAKLYIQIHHEIERLVGQVELRRKLALNINEPLNQRIIMRYHLEGLTRKELPLYLKHCLNRVGISHPLFSEPAIEAIYQASKGIPRKVNLLAQGSLMACVAKKAQIVDADHVREAVTETS